MQRGRRSTWILVLAAALLVGGAAWLYGSGRQATRALDTEVAPRRTAAVARPEVPRLALANDGLPIMPARATDPVPDGPVHPHPITPEHQRIFEENRLIGALNGAVDVGDAAGIRQLLDHYRAEYPEDGQMLQGGYQAIADCLDHPGPESSAAAGRWAADHRGSTVRRFVNRMCHID